MESPFGWASRFFVLAEGLGDVKVTLIDFASWMNRLDRYNALGDHRFT
ncbi:hypothetical protein [Sporosarcina sp. P17b]|nr:hypothetical protein [Sporosarcina sp. P17b]